MKIIAEEKKPKLLLLDVYGTLINMSDTEKRINRLLDNKRAYLVWLELLMEYCFVDNCTVQFNSFDEIARATLQMAAKMFDEKIDSHEINTVVDSLKHLPIQEGVPDCLSKLHDAGYRIAALTNASGTIVTARMEMTGLISYFEKVLSAETVQKYKPALSVYQWATKELDVLPEEVLLVTSHSWDICGADNAGMSTAYIKSSSRLLYPLAPEPRFLIRNLTDLVNQLEACYPTAGEKS